MILRRFLLCLSLGLLLSNLPAAAASFDNPLDAITSNPRLSEAANMLKKTGYDQPLGMGGDVTYLVLSNKFFSDNKGKERFTLLQYFRDMMPAENLLQIFQAMTIDGQTSLTQMSDLVAAQGNGKPVLNTLAGPNGSKYAVFRATDSNGIVLEDSVLHSRILLTAENEIVTSNGTVIIVDTLLPAAKSNAAAGN